ncbi:MAG TPA: BrxA family protein, partial [Chloroflexia bacterium]
MTQPDTATYTSKIIKAGALLPDTKMLLVHWDQDTDMHSNLARMRRENLFGKASRSRIEDILAIFRQRYLSDPSLLTGLLTLVQAHFPTEALDPILYYLSARSDALLHDAVAEVLFPRLSNGQNNIHVDEIEQWIHTQVSAGKSESPWGKETIERCAQGIMATLRDFGILQGKVNKHISPLYLPTTAFAFIAF